MTVFDATVRINRVPCWGLRFFDETDSGGQGPELLTLDHGTHTAEIDLALQGGLTAGRMAITLGRLRAEDFDKLATPQTERVERGDTGQAGQKRLFVQVAMFWKNPLVPVGDFDDDQVIETFRITKMSREVDGLDVVTKIEGRRALFDRIALCRTPEGDGLTPADQLAAVGDVLASAGFVDGTDFELHAAPSGTPPNPQRVMPQKPLLQVLAKLRTQMIRRPPHRRGRSLYLIRANKLFVGPYRPIPHDGDAKEMNAGVGLISVRKTGTTAAITSDETAVGEVPPGRTNYELRCAGRMDIQPGDIVTFAKPSETGSLFGGFGLPSLPGGLGGEDETVQLYVSDVAQKLSRAEGWITTVAGVSVPGTPLDQNAWDVVQTREAALPEDDDASEPGTPAHRLARSVVRRINHAFNSRPVSTIGEIRDYNIETRESGGVIEAAAHSSVVLRGIHDLGGPRQARLDDIDRDRNDLQSNTPYVTSFAWGPFGHVLPRYPGMRVMLLNNRRDEDDPVEIGALWKTSDAAPSSAPTNTQAGDWWLILPAYGSADPPGAAPGTDPVTPEDGLKASHDLITAKGERVIEVNGFIIRAHEPGSLTGPSDRPQVATAGDDEGGIVIEQVDGGSKIRMLKDGSVEIEAGADLTLKANNINLIARSGGTVDASNE